MELITDYSYLTFNIFSVRNLNGCKFFNIGIQLLPAQINLYLFYLRSESQGSFQNKKKGGDLLTKGWRGHIII